MVNPDGATGFDRADIRRNPGDPMPALFSFRGRLNRIQHFSLGCLLGLLGTLLSLALQFVAGIDGSTVLGLLFAAAQLGVSVRRLHDRDVSGLWMLLLLVPFVNVLFLLYLFFVPGQDVPNRFGPPPAPSSFWIVIGWLVLWLGYSILMGWMALLAVGLEEIESLAI
jgi:uncharacterized membrane protein YhaH (DUF805 family)